MIARCCVSIAVIAILAAISTPSHAQADVSKLAGTQVYVQPPDYFEAVSESNEYSFFEYGVGITYRKYAASQQAYKEVLDLWGYGNKQEGNPSMLKLLGKGFLQGMYAPGYLGPYNPRIAPWADEDEGYVRYFGHWAPIEPGDPPRPYDPQVDPWAHEEHNFTIKVGRRATAPDYPIRPYIPGFDDVGRFGEWVFPKPGDPPRVPTPMDPWIDYNARGGSHGHSFAISRLGGIIWKKSGTEGVIP